MVGFGRAASSVQRQLAAAFGIAGLGVVTRGILQVGASFDSLRRALAAVSPSARLAREEFAKLREVARLPGLGLEEAIQASVRLQAVGADADFARRQLLAFGNAIATTGGGAVELERVTVQLAQMAAKGKILQQDLRPLLESAPAIGKALRDAFGTVDPQVIEDLGLTFEQAMDKILLELEKLPKVTGGLRNSFENTRDSIKLAADTLSQAMQPAVERIANSVATLAEQLARVDPATIRALGIAFLQATGIILGAVAAMKAMTLATVLLQGGLRGLVGFIGPAGLITIGIGVLTGLLFKFRQEADLTKQALNDFEGRVESLTDRFRQMSKAAAEALRAAAQGRLAAAKAERDALIAQGRPRALPGLPLGAGGQRGLDTAGPRYDADLRAANAAIAEQQAVIEAANIALGEHQVRLRAAIVPTVQLTVEQKKLGTQYRDTVREMRLQIAEQRALAAAEAKGELAVELVRIQYDALRKVLEATETFRGKQLTTILALIDAHAREAAQLEINKSLEEDIAKLRTAIGSGVFKPSTGTPLEVELEAQNNQLEEQAQRYADVARSAIQVADALGLIDSEAARALQTMVQLGEAIAQIASGNLTGGIAQALGALASLLGGNSREEEERRRVIEENSRQLERLREEMRNFIDAIGPLQQASEDLAKDFRKQFNLITNRNVQQGTFGEDLVGARGFVSRQIESIRLTAPNHPFRNDLAELEALLSDIERAIERITQQVLEDLELRELAATKGEEAVEKRRQEIRDQKELDDAIAAGLDESVIARIKYVQGLEAEKRAQEEATRAAEEAAAALKRQAEFQQDLDVSIEDLVDPAGAEARRIQRDAERRREEARELFTDPAELARVIGKIDEWMDLALKNAQQGDTTGFDFDRAAGDTALQRTESRAFTQASEVTVQGMFDLARSTFALDRERNALLRSIAFGVSAVPTGATPAGTSTVGPSGNGPIHITFAPGSVVVHGGAGASGAQVAADIENGLFTQLDKRLGDRFASRSRARGNTSIIGRR